MILFLCETSLNDSIKLPDILLNDYTFLHSKNSTNIRHGGVGLFIVNQRTLVWKRRQTSNEYSIILL